MASVPSSRKVRDYRGAGVGIGPGTGPEANYPGPVRNNTATTSATVTTLNPIPNATAQRSTALPVMDHFRFVNLYLS